MRIHIVGGFLGSGKTTAIIEACRQLMAGGARTAVVTNDQGKYLVDSAFVSSLGIPSVEVTGGCFCCNYDQLDERIEQVKSSYQPDILFAESVGSCADMVATVLKPLLELKDGQNAPASFSVFCDARLLLARLGGSPLPFSDDVLYIFDKQIEEAGLLVINKIDLLPHDSLEELISIASPNYPEKTMLMQNSLDAHSVASWVQIIENGKVSLPLNSLEIDYDRYGSGETRLAWLDEEIVLEAPRDEIKPAIISLIESILEAFHRSKAVVGHLKLLLRTDGGEIKLSITSPDDTAWRDLLSGMKGTRAILLLNARVEMAADELHRLIDQSLDSSTRGSGAVYHVNYASAFHPHIPSPTHRFFD